MNITRLAISLTLIAGCLETTDAIPELGQTSSSTEASNQIFSNQIFSNQIFSNQIFSNQIFSNQIFSNQLSSGLISSSHLASGMVSGSVVQDGDTIYLVDEASAASWATDWQPVLKKVALCTLPAGSALGVYDSAPTDEDGYDEHQGGIGYYRGGIGLVPDWPTWPATQELTTTQKRDLFTCLVAHINDLGENVVISWRRSADEELADQEVDDYLIYEGTFFGHIDDRDRVHLYSCEGVSHEIAQSLSGDRDRRACTNVDGERQADLDGDNILDDLFCGTTSLGRCQDICNDFDRWVGWTDCHLPDGAPLQSSFASFLRARDGTDGDEWVRRNGIDYPVSRTTCDQVPQSYAAVELPDLGTVSNPKAFFDCSGFGGCHYYCNDGADCLIYSEETYYTNITVAPGSRAEIYLTRGESECGLDLGTPEPIIWCTVGSECVIYTETWPQDYRCDGKCLIRNTASGFGPTNNTALFDTDHWNSGTVCDNGDIAFGTGTECRGTCANSCGGVTHSTNSSCSCDPGCRAAGNCCGDVEYFCEARLGELVVDPSATADDGDNGRYSTIQAAIDASAEHGSIFVTPGTYAESLSVGKSLSLRAGSRITPGVTVDGEHDNANQSILTVEYQPTADSLVDIDAMRFANGGSRAAIINYETLTLTRSEVLNTSAWYGGVKNIGTATLDDVLISGNVGTRFHGGGVSNILGTLTLRNATIDDNEGFMGAGVHNDRGAVTMENSAVTNNRAVTMSGGWSNHNCGGSVTVDDDSTVVGNVVSGSIISNSYEPSNCSH